jgi:xanthine dehydrogenase iron-sulfur cluster and FAD-binding subunit A
VPYLLHPDKITAIEGLIKKNGATAVRKRTTPGGNPKATASPTGSPLIDAMAQKLFLERQMKQQGRL